MNNETSVNRIKPIMELLNYEVRLDRDLAWAWHCNLAMSFYDTGGTHEQANRAAARFMHNMFTVDTSKFPEFLDFEEDWKELPDHWNSCTQDSHQKTPRVSRITNVVFNSGYSSNTIKVYIAMPDSGWQLLIFTEEEALDFIEFAAPVVSIHLKTLMSFPDWRNSDSNSNINMPFFWKINNRIAAELSKLVGEYCLVANGTITNFVESH